MRRSEVVTVGNVLHLTVVIVGLVCFTVLGATHVINGDACVSGILGLVAGAAPAGIGVVAKVEKPNGKAPTP